MFATRYGWLSSFRTLPNLIGLALIVTLLSCDRSGVEQSAPPVIRDKANSEAPTTTGAVKSSDERIRAGYGVPLCHLGMSAKELGTGWAKLKNPYLSDYLYNRSQRIVIMQKAGRVEIILFYYFSPDFEPYLGVTEEGVGAQSAVDEVRKLRGDPCFILERKRLSNEEHSGSLQTLIGYMEDGIVFTFVDGKLELVTVKPPQRNFDYTGIEQDNTAVFIRPREKRTARSAPK